MNLVVVGDTNTYDMEKKETQKVERKKESSSRYSDIYREMFQRNTDWLTSHDSVYDPILGTNQDTRHCIGLVSDGPMIPSSCLCDEMNELGNLLLGTDHETYFQWTSNHSSPSSQWLPHRLVCIRPNPLFITPRVHHTFMIAKPWIHGEYCSEDPTWNPLSHEISTRIPAYSVSFQHFIPVKTGLVLTGYPTVNLNTIRDGFRKDQWVSGELYTNDIVHMTILRWISLPSPVQMNRFLNWCTSRFSLSPFSSSCQKEYIRLSVNTIHITNASWCLFDREYSIFRSIPLADNTMNPK